jgi:hypothetical protein
MIGHYLLTLTPEQEGRALTTPMQGSPRESSAQRCLVMVTDGLPYDGSLMASLAWGVWFRVHSWERTAENPERMPCGGVPARYDALCGRFGDERVNAAIRNRILSNQARRALKPQHAEALGV